MLRASPAKTVFIILAAATALAGVDQVFVGLQSNGSYIIPTGQTITPAGSHLAVGERPLAMAISPDGSQLALITCSTFSNRYVQLIDIGSRTVTQSLPVGSDFAGIAYSPDGRHIYAAGGNDGTIHVFTRQQNGGFAEGAPILLGGGDPSGLSLTPDGARLFVALNTWNVVDAVDLATNAAKQIQVGAFPYTTLTSRDGGTVYVSNWGGHLPPSGANTDGHSPVLVDPATGLPVNGTVSVLNASSLAVIAEIEVGLHPSAMALSPSGDMLYVANSNSDSVSVINTSTNAIVRTIDVRPYADALLGSAPNALALSPDGTTMYVANGGNNAIAVMYLGGEPSVAGFIPSGWFPSAVALTPDGQTLMVASGYGFGSVQQHPWPERNYMSRDGELSFVPIPDAPTLARWTAQVIHNNGDTQRATLAPANLAGAHSPIQHVFYIIKENRTYDQVLGDLGKGNGDPGEVLFGRQITPNHHALAEQFVTLDNFYAAGDTSAMGHQWCNEAYANDYVYKYGGSRNDFAGTNPMAYSPGGFIWDKARKYGKTVRVFGEFAADTVVTPPQLTWLSQYNAWVNGTPAAGISAKSRVAGLRDILAPSFPGFNLNIPDQVRVEAFLSEFQQYEANGSLPNLVIIELSSDHTNGTVPGSPTPRAMMADNDLALGRIVDAISHSNDWGSSAIFVTEDDAQDGNDHMDGHRTVGFVVSPWTRNRGVDSTLYSTIGMVRTIGQILGLPAMTQYDLGATSMFPAFNNQPDLTPYQAIQGSVQLNELNPPLTTTNGLQRTLAIASREMNFSDADDAPSATLNRAIWHSVKGYDTLYPPERARGKR
jgi:YVTN family beta-propeller protein